MDTQQAESRIMALRAQAAALGVTITDNDEGVYLYIPLTLRQVEGAGVLLNSNMGCDDAEHAGMLDEAGLLRACVTVAYELDEDGDAAGGVGAEMECYDWHGGDVGWHRATPLPMELSTGGEPALREANRRLNRDSDTIEILVRGLPGVSEIIDGYDAILEEQMEEIAEEYRADNPPEDEDEDEDEG